MPRREARVLLFGTVLYASVQGLLVLQTTLQGFFETTTPPPEELPTLVPLAIIYGLFTGLVGAFGLAYMGLGLSRARRHDDGGTDRTAVFVAAAAVLATVIGIVSIARLDFSLIPVSATLILYVGSAVALGVIRVVVWALLVAITARGWWAREQPVTGWLLAAIGTGLVLLGIAVVNVASLAQIATEPLQTIYSYAVSAAFAVGHLCLLGAFLVGLPSLDDADAIEAAVDEDDDEVDEDDDDSLDQDGWPVDDPVGALGAVLGQRGRQVPQEVEPLVDLLGRGVRAGHQEARPSGERDPGQLAPRLGQGSPGRDRRAALVDEDDGGRAPDRDLLPEGPDARGQLGIGRLVAGRRDLEQVGDAVAGGRQGVIGGFDRGRPRDDPGRHQPLPERVPEATLVVVAGLHADRRRVQADEQETVTEGRQVGQGLDGPAVHDDRGPMRAGSGTLGQGGEVVGDHRFGVRERSAPVVANPFSSVGRCRRRAASARPRRAPGSPPGPSWPRSWLP